MRMTCYLNVSSRQATNQVTEQNVSHGVDLYQGQTDSVVQQAHATIAAFDMTCSLVRKECQERGIVSISLQMNAPHSG